MQDPPVNLFESNGNWPQLECHFYTQGISEIYWFSIASSPLMRQGYSLLTGEVSDTYEIFDGWLPTPRPGKPWPASDPYGGLRARGSLPLLRLPACLRLSACPSNYWFQPDLGVLVGQRDSHSGGEWGQLPKRGKTSLATTNRLINDREILCGCLPHKSN